MPRTNVAAALAVLLAFIISLFGPHGANVPGQPAVGRSPGSAEIASPLSGGDASIPYMSWAKQTGLKLQSSVVPNRDLVALTQRLKRHSDAPVPHVVNTASPNYPVGTRQEFNIADLVNKNVYQIAATVQYVTPHAYWYVKQGYPVDLTALRGSADYFESHIYPTDRRIFGSEPNPGIDNDPHITVLLAPMVGLNGYFSLSDAYPKAVNPFSNEREMIYIGNKPEGQPGDRENGFEATLAHEFQHMIHWNVHANRDVWLDEGCSEVAMYANGYDPGGFDALFEASPDTQLNAWASEPGLSLNHYGASYKFLRYLMEHYGGETFISSILKQNGLGVDALNSAIKIAGNPAGFEGAFKDWRIAEVITNGGSASVKYAYSQGGRSRVTRLLQQYPTTTSETVHQYGADYIKLSGNLGPATVLFHGDTTAKVLPTTPRSGQAFWYSNRRDSGDATMTRDLDLSRTRSANLLFSAWYDIEAGFDYAYVEVSTDGGHFWTSLKARYTTTDNPNGQNFGQGWTGKSGVKAGSTAAPAWVQESVNLSAYAGRKVKVRFEYVTDEGYNAPGMAIDDLRVPEIGYYDNAESDNGWDASGFVRIGNTMPQRWFVALIENGQTPRVREVPIDALGNGSISLDGFGSGKSVRDAILVVSPMAPKTTETANYTLTAKKK